MPPELVVVVICVVVGSVQVVVVADGIASTRFVSISFLGAFRSRSLCVGYLRVVSHLRSICHTVLLMCVSSRCGSSTVSYIALVIELLNCDY
jgi:hypothetical protein